MANPPQKPPVPNPAYPKSTAPNTVRVTASGFDPERIEVKVGDTVTWCNDTTDVHNVTFDAVPTISADLTPNGGTFSHTVTAPGEHHYHCQYHLEMKGVIVAK